MLTKLLLDDGKDLLAGKLGRNALDSGQGLTSITLCCGKDMLADGPDENAVVQGWRCSHSST